MFDDQFSYLDTFSEGTELGEKADISVSVVEVAIGMIDANPYQPRKHFEPEALADLASSIAQFGVLQPLLVAPYENGRYMLIAGERRLRASKLANLKTVPVIVSDYSSQQIAEIALIENLQREDLHFLEEAEGYEKLMVKFRLTQEAMASRVGKKQSTIANKLRILKLPVAVRKIIKENNLSERHARALLKLYTEEQQLEVLGVVLKQELNVRQTEQYIEGYLEEHEESAQLKKKKRLMIVQDVRIYLNSIKQIAKTIEVAGIPCKMQQELDGNEVVVTLRIANTKKDKK